MAKMCLKKPSKRKTCKLRYKIDKKVKDHNRKVKRVAKKTPRTKKPKTITVPNECPFKEDILKEAELVKQQKQDEIKKKKELAKLEKKKMLEEKSASTSMDSLVQNAETRAKIHDAFNPNEEKISDEVVFGPPKRKENTLRAYYKEFKKVVEEAEVLLEVVDARDPLGTRCIQVENAVRESGTKRLVVVVNKADLVPRENLNAWLKYLRRTVPAVPFKASTQHQKKYLGRKKFWRKRTKITGSPCVGAELLMGLLANYCRNKGIKTSITVGIVGLPNVGKSSIINSLKRSKACSVGSNPGITTRMQVIQLDSKIKLLDSPGIVFASNKFDTDNSVALKNAISVGDIIDPITPATAVIQRFSKNTLMDIYTIPQFDTAEEFLVLLAKSMGRYRRGGVPNQMMAAKILLHDWNMGKLKYLTEPPEVPTEVHLDAQIMSLADTAKEFDIDSFEAMETEVLGELAPFNSEIELTKITSTGPVSSRAHRLVEMEVDRDMGTELLPKSIMIQDEEDKPARGPETRLRKKKVDVEMELEGNTRLNHVKKMEFKKAKKDMNRREKVALSLANDLEGVTLTTINGDDENDEYSFDEHFGL